MKRTIVSYRTFSPATNTFYTNSQPKDETDRTFDHAEVDGSDGQRTLSMASVESASETRSHKDAAETPLPKLQMVVLCCVVFIEPLTLTLLYPFMYSMVKGFDMVEDDRSLGKYVGILASVFSLAQFLTSLPWGWISGRIGKWRAGTPVESLRPPCFNGVTF
jgi:hypothetical protein